MSLTVERTWFVLPVFFLGELSLVGEQGRPSAGVQEDDVLLIRESALTNHPHADVP